MKVAHLHTQIVKLSLNWSILLVDTNIFSEKEDCFVIVQH
jgi:hypothetical protein